MFLFVHLISLHDLLHQRMPYNVLAGQRAECNVIDPAQYIDCNLKTAPGIKGKVLLRQVSGDDHSGAETDSRQEHLHLSRGRILRFIQDDKRIVERAAAHISKRCNLDRTLLGILGVTLRPHDLIERIVQRTKIWIHLALQVTWKETQFLSGFYGRPGHDDPGHFLIPESSDCHRHGKIRLARSGRADSECDHVVSDGIYIFLLTVGLGADRLPADRVADDVAIDLGDAAVMVFQRQGQIVIHDLLCNRLTLQGKSCQIFKDLPGTVRTIPCAYDLQSSAPADHRDIQRPLDRLQIPVKLTEYLTLQLFRDLQFSFNKCHSVTFQNQINDHHHIIKNHIVLYKTPLHPSTSEESFYTGTRTHL